MPCIIALDNHFCSFCFLEYFDLVQVSVSPFLFLFILSFDDLLDDDDDLPLFDGGLAAAVGRGMR